MEELIARLVANVGVDRTAAEKAVGIILDFLRKEGPADKVQTLIDGLPGAEALLQAQASDAGGGMFAMGGLMGAGSKMMAAGLSMGQVQGVTKETIGFAYPITDIDGIDGDVAAVLKSAGIRSTGKLLDMARTVKGRKALSEKTGFNEKQLLCWANVADRMRIRGIRKEYAELLQAAGVDTVKELTYRNPANLAKAMADANKKSKKVRLLPSEKVVGRWIESAQTLPLKITY
jgi:hypothetical protein